MTATIDGRRARGDASRRAVLARATQLASVEGLDGLSIGALASATRRSKSTVATLFGDKRQAECVIAWEDATPVGLAIFFHNYSTWLARHGLYLEDLFVLPTHRSKGYGRALLKYLAKLAVERGCGRFEWAVLDWNEPAIGFYKALGAKPMDEWTVYRMTGDALARLASDETP